MAKYKVDITGINTSEIIVLSNEEMTKLFVEYQNGNLDAKEIQKLFEKHGIDIDQKSINFRRSINIMDKIKLDRNNLGHGSMAFTEALRENTINELEDSYNYVKNFLDELIVFVGDFLKNKEYQQKSA